MSTPSPVVPAVAGVVNDPNNNPNPAPPTPEPEKVTFTEAQQAKIDQIIRDAQGRAASAVRDQLKAANYKLAELEKQLQNAQNAARPDASEVDQLRVQLDQAKAETAAVKAQHAQDKRDAAILQAAAAENYIDPRQALKLLKDNIKVGDDGTVTVVDDNGEAIEGTNVREFVKQFGQKNDNLLKGSVKGGSGSGPSSGSPALPAVPLETLFGKNSDSKLANVFALRDPVRYSQMRKEAQKRGLI